MSANESNQQSPKGLSVFGLFLAMLVIGSAGYFTLRGHWSFYYFAHLGALGVMGLLGSVVALIARAKGRDFWPAFGFGFAGPIILGAGAVLTVRFLGESGTYFCGGAVCLGAALLAIVGYSLPRRKPRQIKQP